MFLFRDASPLLISVSSGPSHGNLHVCCLGTQRCMSSAECWVAGGVANISVVVLACLAEVSGIGELSTSARSWGPLWGGLQQSSLQPGFMAQGPGGRALSSGHGLLPARLEQRLLSTLRPAAHQAYLRMLSEFRVALHYVGVEWASLTESERDYVLAEYILQSVEDAVLTVSNATVLWAALSKVAPRERDKTAWKLIDVLKADHPPRQAPAMPAELAYAVSVSALLFHQSQVATVCLICFCGLLRVGEALSLCWESVYMTEQVVALVLQVTKRGVEQRVLLRHPDVVAWPRSFWDRAGRPAAGRLFSVSYIKVQYWLRKLTCRLGFQSILFKTHSFRRGGASELARMNWIMADICLFGRWSSSGSAKEYIRRGKVFVMKLRKGVEPQCWARTRALAALAAQAWSMVLAGID